MTGVYFVRHAESNNKNHNDLMRELTEKGLRDRTLVTDFLRDKNIQAVLSSPYKRAFDTVKELADELWLTIEVVDDFRERKVDGVWIEDFIAFSKQQWTDFNFKLSDGESLGDVQRRNIMALNDVLEKYNGKNIAIGSHGTALSTVINYYDHTFGYSDFEKIKPLMPWIVKLSFDGKALRNIEKYDLFSL